MQVEWEFLLPYTLHHTHPKINLIFRAFVCAHSVKTNYGCCVRVLVSRISRTVGRDLYIPYATIYLVLEVLFIRVSKSEISFDCLCSLRYPYIYTQLDLKISFFPDSISLRQISVWRESKYSPLLYLFFSSPYT